MNVCMVSPFSSEAPSALRLLSFGREIVKKGHTVSVVLPSFDRYKLFIVESDPQLDGIKLVRPFQLKSRNSETSMMSYVASATLKILSLSYDVVHVQKPIPLSCPGYLAKIRSRAPLVQDIDDLEYASMMAQGQPKTRIWFVKQFEKFLLRFADQIVTCSSYLERFYENSGIEKNRMTWIPSGVHASEFDLKPNLHIKENYQLKDAVITYVGSLGIENQISMLIKAMELVVREKQSVSCLIIGDGKARPYLENLVKKLGLSDHFTFVGHVPHSQVPELLSISDISYACFPRVNYMEAASNIKVFEYMAAGVPPVVSPVGDLPYYVDFGKAGVIARFDINGVSEALLYLLNDERERRIIGKHARQHVRENFDWKVLARKLLSVYEKLQ